MEERRSNLKDRGEERDEQMMDRNSSLSLVCLILLPSSPLVSFSNITAVVYPRLY